MNLGKDFLDRLGIDRWPRRKKIIIGVAGFLMLFLILFTVSLYQVSSDSEKPRVNLLPNKKKPEKDLTYDFIKLDTLKIPTFSRNEPPREPDPIPDRIYQAPRESEKPKQKTPRPKTTPQTVTPPPTTPGFSSTPSAANKNPNMIVMNNLNENQISRGGLGGRLGGQSALVKVVLPDNIPVANGSMVEARAIRDAEWGDIFIPKRSKFRGTASLFNDRVNIDFREIIIHDTSRSCSGRAYDLKQMEGLAYSPVSNETKEILMDELRNATTGVPFVGSITNRATRSGSIVNEVARLDEGLEFYVLVNSIF
jgi:hypothetical protein